MNDGGHLFLDTKKDGHCCSLNWEPLSMKGIRGILKAGTPKEGSADGLHSSATNLP